MWSERSLSLTPFSPSNPAQYYTWTFKIYIFQADDIDAIYLLQTMTWEILIEPFSSIIIGMTRYFSHFVFPLIRRSAVNHFAFASHNGIVTFPNVSPNLIYRTVRELVTESCKIFFEYFKRRFDLSNDTLLESRLGMMILTLTLSTLTLGLSIGLSLACCGGDVVLGIIFLLLMVVLMLLLTMLRFVGCYASFDVFVEMMEEIIKFLTECFTRPWDPNT